jgi:hypothetical protein
LIFICKACSAPLTSRASVPSSPTPHLHRTTQAPDALEAISLRTTLRHANSNLDELDDDIAHAQVVLDELRRKCAASRKFTTEHGAFFAPIRRLPPEILIHIFLHCIPDYRISSFHPGYAPLLVGQVCIGWRQIILSTQKLWSSITIDYPRRSNQLARLWSSRAISVPLTIRLDSDNLTSRETEQMRPVLAELVQSCDRWKHLDLRLHHSLMLCLDPIKHCLPWLESLRLVKPGSSGSWNSEFNIFEHASRLRNLSLGPGVSHSNVKIPWHHLTELNAHVRTITGCLETLQLVPNLVKCTVYAPPSSRTSVLTQNIPILTFPHLRFFCVLGLVHPTELFNHLDLPILHTLHVGCETKRHMDSWFSQQPFMSFLSCSSRTLRKLKMGCLRELGDSAHIAQCLRATPSLTELSLRGSGHWLTTDLLQLLTRRPCIDPLVPDLEVLEICASFICCCHYAGLIESRWRAADDDYSGARLKKMRAEIQSIENWSIDAIWKRLLKCRQEGMDISVIDIRRHRNLLDSHDRPTDAVQPPSESP